MAAEASPLGSFPTEPTAAPAEADAPETADEGVQRRGPFRPARLVSLRQRQSGRDAAHGFRLADVIALLVASVVVLDLVEHDSVFSLTVGQALPIVVAGLTTGRLLRSVGLYRFGRREHVLSHLGRLAGCVAAGGGAGSLTVLVAGGEASVGDVLAWVVPIFGLLLVLHAIWWLIVRRWRADGRLTPNIVIVGATRHAEQIVEEALARRDMNVLGIFDDRLARSPRHIAGVPVLGNVDALVEHRITPFVDLIVIAVDPSAHARVREVAQRLSTLPNDVVLLVDDEGAGRHAALARLADAPLSPLDVVADPGRKAFAKRIQDVTIGGAVLVLLSPVIGVVALAVRLDSPGPVFFRQRRHGFNNEEIVVWKFRTMRVETTDAQAVRQVTADDDRVTRVGRILRSTSLDELPQLLNVLAGSMSLVGPRPHAIGMRTGDEVSAGLVADYAHRHRIKPGMTGWAAIHGSRGPLHSAADVRRRVALDVDYIDRQSFWLDAWVMAMTVPAVFGDRSAIR